MENSTEEQTNQTALSHQANIRLLLRIKYRPTATTCLGTDITAFVPELRFPCIRYYAKLADSDLHTPGASLEKINFRGRKPPFQSGWADFTWLNVDVVHVSRYSNRSLWLMFFNNY